MADVANIIPRAFWPPETRRGLYSRYIFAFILAGSSLYLHLVIQEYGGDGSRPWQA